MQLTAAVELLQNQYAMPVRACALSFVGASATTTRTKTEIAQWFEITIYRKHWIWLRHQWAQTVRKRLLCHLAAEIFMIRSSHASRQNLNHVYLGKLTGNQNLAHDEEIAVHGPWLEFCDVRVACDAIMRLKKSSSPRSVSTPHRSIYQNRSLVHLQPPSASNC